MLKNHRPGRSTRRRSLLELMEPRLPLAGAIGHNFLMPGDVNNDQTVKASDALAIINVLAQQSGDVSGATEAVDASLTSMFYDVNDDGQTSASDALRVINEIAREGGSSDASEFFAGEAGAQVRIEFELKGAGFAELEIRLVDAPADAIYGVTVGGDTLGQIQTNDQGRGKLELKFGGSRRPLPDVLAGADATTPVAIGDIVSGTLGSLGEIGSSDGGSDGLSDGNSDASSDGSSDGLSDASSDGMSDATSDSGSDNIATLPESIAVSSASSSGGSSLADGSTDGGTDGGIDGESDGSPDASSDASTDGGSDGPVRSTVVAPLVSSSSDSSSTPIFDGDTDGSLDGNSDGSSDAGSDGSSDGGSD